MPQEYIFEFSGTKADFLNHLKSLHQGCTYSDDTFYYFDDYIVKLNGDDIQFGIARGSEHGGYWFIPTVTDFGNRIEFRGTIQYIEFHNESPSPIKKTFNKIGEYLLFVLILPLLLAFWLYTLIKRLTDKLSGSLVSQDETLENRLVNLMENRLRCTTNNTVSRRPSDETI